MLAGWQLPPNYVLNADKLQDWLLKLPNWQRIKGIIHTSDGWLQINFTPDSLTMTTVSTQIDSRLEIILQASEEQNTGIEAHKADLESESQLLSSIDWESCDRELMTMVISM